MQWPSHFPNDCPPEDSQSANGEFYRLVRHNPPKERDFKSYREEQPEREYKDIPECQLVGLSVYSDLDGIIRLLERIPALRKKRRPAKGELIPDLGRIKNTGKDKSHHTWWLPIGKMPWEIFYVVDFPMGYDS